ncbi:ATP-binding SpoIIE family protein phosphatase [Streptomyces lonarensis]|uniref:SpoIIE family protein phosphatase n=1 Tax=Streptomyces lonarensis TaxID=700599 RepID=A0A7X6HZZ2_9ACTN|nr:SpoIIE family protein phosphatase [Streptomyces lonarensis]NJQ07050.1 SpoIIE family protein phosphatase [Streptomyces lonarensis]
MKLTRWGIRLPGTQRRTAPAAITAAKPVPAARDGRPGRHDARTAAGAEPAEENHHVAQTDGNDPPDGPGTPGASHASATDAEFVHGPAVHELLGQVPAPVALVHGSDHRLAYVNEAYAALFGPRTPGSPARESLTELEELGLVPLMDQVRRSNTSRTIKSRRVRGPRRDTFHTFTCTPVELSAPEGPPVRGVLVFAADVTDQVTSAERLRESEGRQRETAVTLQRSLLPQELEQPDELRVAATYHPGGTETAVGGDWYDVITLGAGRTAVVIGDVMGRGVRAAAVMGQLRTAVRAYARLDMPPHEVVQLLDGLASEIDPTQIATCVYAVHDPSEDTLSYASAGHLPIVVRRPDGTVHRTPGPTGPPLGTGDWVHESAAIPFPPGSSAVLCTDGLVERRDADIDAGLDTMEEALAVAADSPQILCDRLLRALGISDGHDDDVAILAFTRPQPEGADAGLFRAAALDLHGGIEATPRARAFAGGVLSSWRFPDELRDLGVLTASELVANSVVHGKAPMRLRLRRTDRRLIIEVTDGDEHLPRHQQVRLGDETGRGIALVAAVATDWGTRRLPEGGKSVWAEFALPAPAAL